MSCAPMHVLCTAAAWFLHMQNKNTLLTYKGTMALVYSNEQRSYNVLNAAKVKDGMRNRLAELCTQYSGLWLYPQHLIPHICFTFHNDWCYTQGRPCV